MPRKALSNQESDDPIVAAPVFVLPPELAEKAIQTLAKSQSLLSFDRESLIELEKLFGRNFHTPDELINSIKILKSVAVAGIEVDIPAVVWSRLQSRGKNFPEFDKWLGDVIVRLLEGYVQLR
jgi:hypothetical protein